MSMIIVTGRIEAKPDCYDEVMRLSLEHVARSRAEPGCIDHRVAVDCENAMQFVFVEYWADMPALMTHFAVEASQKFVKSLTPLVATKPDMRVFNADEVSVG